MGETIIDGTGSGYAVRVSPEGRMFVDVSGLDISIGSLALSLENVYIQSGNNVNLGSAWTNIGSVLVSNFPNPMIILGSIYDLETNPAASNKFNYKTVIVYSGTAPGSIYREHSTGSWLQTLTYDASDNVTNVSAWSVV